MHGDPGRATLASSASGLGPQGPLLPGGGVVGGKEPFISHSQALQPQDSLGLSPCLSDAWAEHWGGWGTG